MTSGIMFMLQGTTCVILCRFLSAIVGVVRHYSHGALTITGPEGNSSTVYASEPKAGATGMLSLSMGIALFGGLDTSVVKVIKLWCC